MLRLLSSSSPQISACYEHLDGEGYENQQACGQRQPQQQAGAHAKVLTVGSKRWLTAEKSLAPERIARPKWGNSAVVEEHRLYKLTDSLGIGAFGQVDCDDVAVYMDAVYAAPFKKQAC